METLEDERRTLETMGGAGDEIQRQIGWVQQIYNMGDFVKASRASQEIRQRAHEQQLVRSEEALSHAKLALVELAEIGPRRGRAEGGTRNGPGPRPERTLCRRLSRAASESERQAVDLARQAQTVAEGLVLATDRWQKMSRDGVEVWRSTIESSRRAPPTTRWISSRPNACWMRSLNGYATARHSGDHTTHARCRAPPRRGEAPLGPR